MAAQPEASLPRQNGSWADLLGAYRLFNNPSVEPGALQAPHYQQTHLRCLGQPVVLCVQDTSTLDYTRFKLKKGLGPIDRQNGQGLLQHTVLAVLPSGRLLGVLNQRWHVRVPVPEGETLKQRRGRWRESLFWSQGIEATGKPSDGTRFITVADRAANCFETFQACKAMDHGWIIRAQHDRSVEGKSDHLWSLMAQQPVLKTIKVKVAARAAKATTNRGLHGAKQPARTARVEIRARSAVQLDVPHGQRDHDSPLTMNVVYAREIDAPAEVSEPIDWMLLTSEPVDSAQAALVIAAWYRCRWVVEEYHKVQKSGCGLEETQLQDVQALRRFAAVVGVCAVRMLWLRDLASAGLEQSNDSKDSKASATPVKTPASEDPKALAALMPPLWIAVVARLAHSTPDALTPRIFWRTIAKRGGWLARKHDGRPGWKALWDGWHQIALMVQGAALIASG